VSAHGAVLLDSIGNKQGSGHQPSEKQSKKFTSSSCGPVYPLTILKCLSRKAPQDILHTFPTGERSSLIQSGLHQSRSQRCIARIRIRHVLWSLLIDVIDDKPEGLPNRGKGRSCRQGTSKEPKRRERDKEGYVAVAIGLFRHSSVGDILE
jgi:hypothetical protein